MKQPKRTTYIILSVIFGFILSIVVHAALEIWYLGEVIANGEGIIWYSGFGMADGACSFPLYLQYGLLVLGLISGYLLGRWWWKIVYVEKLHHGSEEK